MLAVPASARAAPKLLEAAVEKLTAAGVDGSRLDAELLMAEALGASRVEVLTGSLPMTGDQAERFARLVARRAAREPFAYIVGRREFFSLDFKVTPAVLIPRPETETTVNVVLELTAARPAAVILDLGTGCGAIALAIAANAPGSRVAASDISKEALEVARDNAVGLGLARRVAFACADLLGGFAGQRFDIIASNPPYVADAMADTLAFEVRRFEPLLALFAGPDGLAFYRRILAAVRGCLRPGGALVMEVGVGQADEVAVLCRAAGAGTVGIIDDLAGIPRVVRASF